MSNAVVTNPLEVRVQHYRDAKGLYTGKGFQAINRHWAYKNQVSPDMQKVAIASITAGALTGAATGGKVGEEVVEAYFYDEDLRSDSLKKQAGRWIGAVLGAVTGAVISTILYIVVVEKTDGFKVWREMKVSQILRDYITSNYYDDAVLQDHWCPISLIPLIIPARTPSGVCYDLEWLLNCKREEDNKIRDPYGNPSFHEDDIVIDFERGVIINKRIRHLIQEDIAQLPADSPLQETLGEQITAINNIIRQHYDSAKEAIDARKRSNELSADKYCAALLCFFSHCGDSVEENLAWN